MTKYITEVWCVDRAADDKNFESGLKLEDTKDSWVPFGFDLKDVMTLKKTQAGDFIEEGEATTLTFYPGDNIVTVRIPFDELAKEWEEI